MHVQGIYAFAGLDDVFVLVCPTCAELSYCPLMHVQGIYAFVGLDPVFVPDVEVNETFNFPHTKGVPNAYNPNPGTQPPYNEPYDSECKSGLGSTNLNQLSSWIRENQVDQGG